MDRIIDKFPSDRQNQIRAMLGDALKGVVAQTLCRKIGGGRVAAFEVLLVNVPVANHIREAQSFMIPSVMQTSRNIGMQTFGDDLTRLVLQGKITPEEAYIKAIDKETIRVSMQNAGIPMDFLNAAAEQERNSRLEQANALLTLLRGKHQENAEDIGTLNDLAWLLSTCVFDEIRNGKEALRLAERARDITRGQEPAVLDTLGAAYAETGRFKRAIDSANKAIDIFASRNDLASVGALKMRIKEYSQDKPHRDL